MPFDGFTQALGLENFDTVIVLEKFVLKVPGRCHEVFKDGPLLVLFNLLLGGVDRKSLEVMPLPVPYFQPDFLGSVIDVIMTIPNQLEK